MSKPNKGPASSSTNGVEATSVEDRIRHLEDLMMTFMSHQNALGGQTGQSGSQSGMSEPISISMMQQFRSQVGLRVDPIEALLKKLRVPNAGDAVVPGAEPQSSQLSRAYEMLTKKPLVLYDTSLSLEKQLKEIECAVDFNFIHRMWWPLLLQASLSEQRDRDRWSEFTTPYRTHVHSYGTFGIPSWEEVRKAFIEVFSRVADDVTIGLARDELVLAADTNPRQFNEEYLDYTERSRSSLIGGPAVLHYFARVPEPLRTKAMEEFFKDVRMGLWRPDGSGRLDYCLKDAFLYVEATYEKMKAAQKIKEISRTLQPQGLVKSTSESKNGARPARKQDSVRPSSDTKVLDRREQREPNRRVVCYHCHQPGHKLADCPRRSEEDVRFDRGASLSSSRAMMPVPIVPPSTAPMISTTSQPKATFGGHSMASPMSSMAARPAVTPSRPAPVAARPVTRSSSAVASRAVSVLEAVEEQQSDPYLEVYESRRVAIAIMPEGSDVPTLHLISKEELEQKFVEIPMEPEDAPEPDLEFGEDSAVRAVEIPVSVESGVDGAQREEQGVITLPRPDLSGLKCNDQYVPVQFVPPRGSRVNAYALADTGAQVSMLSVEVAALMGLELQMGSEVLQLADASRSRPVQRSVQQVTVRCGKKEISVRLIVTTMTSHAIFGQDLLKFFGICLQNIPPFHPDVDAGMVDSVAVDEEEMASSSVEPEPEFLKEREAFVERIMPVFEENNVLVPPDALCTHPAALIRIVHEPDVKPSFRAQYPIPLSYREFVRKQIAEWEETGRIERFKSTVSRPRPSWHMPLNPIVKTRDEQGNVVTLRVTVDARGVNKGVVFDQFPLPDMQKLLHELPGPIWTEIDLQSFYCQLTIHEEDRQKLCFTVDGITYQWRAAPFGLAQLTGQAQFLMETIFADLEFVKTFLDNLLIGSATWEEHFTHLCQVVARLNLWNLRINLPKLKLALDRILALGFMLDRKGVSLDPRKMEAVRNFAVPVNKEQVGRFLGFVGFLRPNIVDFARITAPLEIAKQSFVWGEAQQASFEATKEAVLNSICLVNYDPNKLLHLITDASNVGLSGILYQPEKYGDLPTPDTIIAIASRATRSSERNHSAYKAELNAGRYAMKKFAHYLLGRRFTWLTDHRSLMYLSGCVDMNRILTAWLHEFAEFHFDVIHVEGVRNELADALSRQYVDSFKVEALHIAARAAEVVDDDPKIRELVADAHRWGHFGVVSTLQTLRNAGVHHSKLRDLVEHAIDNCTACRQWSLGRTFYEEPSSSAPLHPFDEICFDAVPMPSARHGFKYLLVVVDQFSGFVILKALRDKSATSLAEALWSVISVFGPPLRITSDGEATNVSLILEKMLAAHGIEHRTIAAYTPRQNGKAEAHVKMVLSVVHKMLHESGPDWPMLIGAASLMINTKHRALMDMDPFRLVFGRAARAFAAYVDIGDTVRTEEQLQEFLFAKEEQLSHLWPARHGRMVDQQAKYNALFKAKHTIAPPLEVGITVMRRDNAPGSKDAAPFVGPYEIIGRNEARRTYTLRDPAGGVYPHDVPREQLKPIKRAERQDDVYYIDRIVDAKVENDQQFYLVKWVGFDNPTWEPASNIDDNNTIRAYWSTQRRLRK